MGNFYKITKAEADLLGRFEYAANMAFDPYSSEQNDGAFIVSEEMYLLLKDNPRFASVDFESKGKIQKDTIKTGLKPTII